MATSPLSKREIQVLLALVKVHVALGVPVGSQTLNQRENLGVSPATIRNTLASLEEKGYISQPHVSAGRIPSEKGYRFYVQRCMATTDAGLDEAEITLRQQLEAAQQEGDYEEILHQLARTIGDLSNQLGLVLAPRFNQGIFHKLELWRLGGRRLLLIVTIRGGLTKSLMVEVNCAVLQRDLEALSRLFNERLHGLTMVEIQHAVEVRMAELGTVPRPVVEAVVRQIEGLATTRGVDLHVSGTRNLCLKPEFDDPSEVAGLIDLVEKKDTLAQLMSERRGVVITIGSEHRPQAMGRCSMVTASYEVAGAKGVVGVLGVIGPTRMPYRPLVSLVNCAASRAANLIC
ncbi:MAG: heat-inducible transcriptional repressor HrcA [Gemmatimonadetes bacterium]|nr:heat-inducible transcriptional repressor HrcA [Gemmatimonadota bacterium]